MLDKYKGTCRVAAAGTCGACIAVTKVAPESQLLVCRPMAAETSFKWESDEPAYPFPVATLKPFLFSF